MSRIPGAFRRLAKSGEAALIPYFTAGVPTLDVTRRLLPVIGRQGADLLMVGLERGGTFVSATESETTTLADCLSIAAEARRSNEVPLVLLARHADFQAQGIDQLVHDCAAAGIDALFVPDMLPETALPLADGCRAVGLDLALAVTPDTPGEQLAELGSVASGFVYCAAGDAELTSLIVHVRLHTDLPVVALSTDGTPEQIAELSHIADGVVVAGVVLSVMENAEEEDLMLDVSEVVRSLKEATHKADPVR